PLRPRRFRAPGTLCRLTLFARQRLPVQPAYRAAGCLDLTTRRRGEAGSLNGQRRRQLPVSEDLHRLSCLTDDPRGEQCLRVDLAPRIEPRELAHVHFFVVDPERVAEPALARHPSDQRQLPAFKAGTNSTAGPRLLALQSLAGIRAVTTRVPTPDALLPVRRALRLPKLMLLHLRCLLHAHQV